MSKKGLVLGILAMVFCWVPVVGLVLGIIGLVKSIKAVKIPEESKGKSITGIVLSASALFTTIICTIVYISIAVTAATYSSRTLYSSPSYYDYDYDYDYDWDDYDWDY